jgi:hypothetical protein
MGGTHTKTPTTTTQTQTTITQTQIASNDCKGPIKKPGRFDEKYYIYKQNEEYISFKKNLSDEYLHKQCYIGVMYMLNIDNKKYYYYKIDTSKFNHGGQYKDLFWCFLLEITENPFEKKIVVILDKCLPKDECDRLINLILENKNNLKIKIRVSYHPDRGVKDMNIKLSEFMNANNQSDIDKILGKNLYDLIAEQKIPFEQEQKGGNDEKYLNENNERYLNGNDERYLNKYLKYKHKYLLLKYQ